MHVLVRNRFRFSNACSTISPNINIFGHSSNFHFVMLTHSTIYSRIRGTRAITHTFFFFSAFWSIAWCDIFIRVWFTQCASFEKITLDKRISIWIWRHISTVFNWMWQFSLHFDCKFQISLRFEKKKKRK